MDHARGISSGMTSKKGVPSASMNKPKWPCVLCLRMCASEAAARWHCLKRRTSPINERRSKFGAIKENRDGHVFASKKEARRYGELKTLEQVGKIRQLELQPKFECLVKGAHICTYIADFRYTDDEGYQVVEDCKGYKTASYRIKKKLVEALYYPLKIIET